MLCQFLLDKALGAKKGFKKGRAAIYNAQGRLAWQQKLEAGSRHYRLDTGTFLTGLYFLKVEIDGKPWVRKLLVE